MEIYTKDYFNFLMKENKMLIEIWENELKHHVTNESTTNSIVLMHSIIISECIEFVSAYAKANKFELSKRFRDDQIDKVVREMSIKEIFTPINYDYILNRFFVKNPLS